MDRQLAGLSEASQKKKQETRAKAEKAIASLKKNCQKITVRSVAREAKISVSYIYKYPELVYKIQRLKEQQKYELLVREKKAGVDKKEVASLRKSNAELAQKIVELEAIIKRVKSSKNTVKSLREENIQLATENIQLKKELQYALENLQSARQFILEQGQINSDSAELEKI